MADSAFARFDAVAEEFRPFHRNSINVLGHLVTTPLGLVMMLGGVNAVCGTPDGSAGFAVTLVYCLSLLGRVRPGMWMLTTVLSAGLSLAASVYSARGLTGLQALLGLAMAYVLQDASHRLTGEATFEGSYMGKGDWLGKFVEHNYFLFPLVLDAVWNMDESFFSWVLTHNYVLFTKVEDAEERSKLDMIAKWVKAQKPSWTQTTHWWYERLPQSVKAAFRDVSVGDTMMEAFYARFPRNAYTVVPLIGMDEIYVACPVHNYNSDTVFYTRHVDGPFHYMPFCHVFRCIVAVNKNVQVKTSFPTIRVAKTLSDGDAACFDFNREIHVISDNDSLNTDHRITLKCHYAVYPKILAPMGWLLGFITTTYDQGARRLFNSTKSTDTIVSRAGAFLILAITHIEHLTEKHLGWFNTYYLFYLTLTCWELGAYTPFLVLTSFAHYCWYIATYHCARSATAWGERSATWSMMAPKINYGEFKRNVVLYKLLALGQLAYWYVRHFDFASPDYVSLALLASGYGVSALAAARLGVDRTYFGVELGYCEPKWVSSFPYNVIPHPMIVGSIVGLLGFHKLAGLRAAFPWLVPVHILFYLAHLSQEVMFDVYADSHEADAHVEPPMSPAKAKASLRNEWVDPVN